MASFLKRSLKLKNAQSKLITISLYCIFFVLICSAYCHGSDHKFELLAEEEIDLSDQFHQDVSPISKKTSSVGFYIPVELDDRLEKFSTIRIQLEKYNSPDNSLAKNNISTCVLDDFVDLARGGNNRAKEILIGEINNGTFLDSQLERIKWSDISKKKAPNPIEGEKFFPFIQLAKTHKTPLPFEFIQMIQDKSVRHDAIAQFCLAYAYFHGLGVPQDIKQAIYLCSKSAAREFALAQNFLGYLNHLDLDCLPGIKLKVAQLSQTSLALYEKAAAQNFAPAHYELGRFYYSKQTNIDFRIAFIHLSTAANLGHAVSQHMLGQLYKLYSTNSRQWLIGMKWINEANDQGFMKANA